jgi:hypothetical protein
MVFSVAIIRGWVFRRRAARARSHDLCKAGSATRSTYPRWPEQLVLKRRRRSLQSALDAVDRRRTGGGKLDKGNRRQGKCEGTAAYGVQGFFGTIFLVVVVKVDRGDVRGCRNTCCAHLRRGKSKNDCREQDGQKPSNEPEDQHSLPSGSMPHRTHTYPEIRRQWGSTGNSGVTGFLLHLHDDQRRSRMACICSISWRWASMISPQS